MAGLRLAMSVVAAAALAPTAMADRYEMTITVRPVGGVGRVHENVGGNDAAPASASRPVGATAYSAGGELGVAYGVRNWLDLEGDLVGAGFTQATYDGAWVSLAGAPTMGQVTRTTRVAQLRVGATLRAGVAWVSTLHLGLGLGARMQGAAMLASAGRPPLTPDGLDTKVALDGAAIVRVGLDHRIDRRWSIGVSAEAVHQAGFGVASIDGISGGLALSYSWYPTVPW